MSTVFIRDLPMKRLTVWIECTYLVPDHENLSEITHDWFVRSNPDSSHAYRDGSKVWGATRLIRASCESDVISSSSHMQAINFEFFQSQQVKRMEKICDAAFPY